METSRAFVIITASSSKLLGQELSTVMTGRHVDLEVFPLSFSEFLQFKNLQLVNDIDLIKKQDYHPQIFR